jgi:membrane protease YdiL (CAAX protease family)
VLGTTAISVVFAWLYVRTGGSLLLTMLLHAAINNSKDIVPSGIAQAPGVFSLSGSLVSWVTLGLIWACAGYLLFDMRKTRGAHAPFASVPA